MNRYLARGDFIESSLLNEDEDQDKDVIASPVSYYGLGPLSGARSDYSPLSTTSKPIKITDMGNSNASALTTAGLSPAKTSGSTQMGSASSLSNLSMSDPLASTQKPRGIMGTFNATLKDTMEKIRESMEGLQPRDNPYKGTAAGGKLGNRIQDNAISEMIGIQPSDLLDRIKRPKPAPLSSIDNSDQINLGTEVDLAQYIADQNKERLMDSERRNEFLRDQSIRDFMGLEDAGFREGTTFQEREEARIAAEKEAARLKAEEEARLAAEAEAKRKAEAAAAAAAAEAKRKAEEEAKRKAQEQQKKKSNNPITRIIKTITKCCYVATALNEQGIWSDYKHLSLTKWCVDNKPVDSFLTKLWRNGYNWFGKDIISPHVNNKVIQWLADGFYLANVKKKKNIQALSGYLFFNIPSYSVGLFKLITGKLVDVKIEGGELK